MMKKLVLLIGVIATILVSCEKGMINFDNQLVNAAEGLAADVDAFKAEITKGETKNAKEKIQNITDKIEAFEETFNKRAEVILGVR